MKRLLRAASILAVALAATSARSAQFDCGQPASSGDKPTAGDALVILRTSVGISTACAQQPCVCDVNGNSLIQVSDALLALRAAVGINVPLNCPCNLSTVELFFGTNGRGSCGLAVVDVDLAASGSIVRLDGEESPDCTADPVLEADGCDFSFQLREDGSLRTVVTGCTVPATSNIFGCVFETPDATALRASATAQCDCLVILCDAKPSVCASPTADPASCEDCDNEIDDDGNGEVDCDDPNCTIFEGCFPVTTSSTSTSTTVPMPTTLP